MAKEIGNRMGRSAVLSSDSASGVVVGAVIGRVDGTSKLLELSFDLALPKRVWSSQSSTGCPRLQVDIEFY